jgi:hypothetical protein
MGERETNSSIGGASLVSDAAIETMWAASPVRWGAAEGVAILQVDRFVIEH